MDQYDVFISFSEEDRNVVDGIYNELSKEYNVFKFDAKKKFGSDIVTKIFNAIDSSMIFIPIISKNSMKSQWCKAECSYAYFRFMSGKIKIIPICVDDAVNPYNFFLTIEYYKLSDEGNNLDEIKDCIDRTISYRVTNLNSILSEIEYTKDQKSNRRDVEFKYLMCKCQEAHSQDFGVLLIYFHNLKKGNTLSKNDIATILHDLHDPGFILIVSEYPVAQSIVDEYIKNNIIIKDISSVKKRSEKIEILRKAFCDFDKEIEDAHWSAYAQDRSYDEWKDRDL